MREIVRNKEGWITRFEGVPCERIRDLLSSKPKGKLPPQKKWVINLKGTNGSGKSTIPMCLLLTDKQHTVYLTMDKDDKLPVAMYCKTYDVVIVGLYMDGVNCGGCDQLGNTQIVKKILSRLWKKDIHIVFEGVIVGDIKSTFYNIMKGFNTVHERHVSFCFMGTRLKECLRRIQRRNGGKPINEEMVLAKYRNSCTHLRYYLDQGDVHCTVLDTKNALREEVLDRFLGLYPDLQPLF